MPTKIAEGRDAEIFAWDDGLVLRLYRDPHAGARADREMAVLAAVRSVLPSVPAPTARIAHDGRPGIVMERVDGHAVYEEISRRPWRVWSLAALVGRLHAELNAVAAPPDLPALRVVLHRRFGADDAIPDDLRAPALHALERLPDGDRLCHGDFQPDTVRLGPLGPVVIDWVNATRGDPAGDFARTAVMMRTGSLPPGTPALIRWGSLVGRSAFRRAYVGGYARVRRFDALHLRRWTLVRAVERLADRIPEERAPLLREARRLR
jgi:aminoglycoside phosphotransferase (APT) family kinase protein